MAYLFILNNFSHTNEFVLTHDTLSVTPLRKQKLPYRNIFEPSHLVITTTEHQDSTKNYYARQMPNKAIHVFRAIS